VRFSLHRRRARSTRVLSQPVQTVLRLRVGAWAIDINPERARQPPLHLHEIGLDTLNHRGQFPVATDLTSQSPASSRRWVPRRPSRAWLRCRFARRQCFDNRQREILRAQAVCGEVETAGSHGWHVGQSNNIGDLGRDARAPTTRRQRKHGAVQCHALTLLDRRDQLLTELRGGVGNAGRGG
jgi:hypothetical protein